MKRILIFVVIFFNTISNVSAEGIKRIIVGNEDAKITIIALGPKEDWIICVSKRLETKI